MNRLARRVCTACQHQCDCEQEGESEIHAAIVIIAALLSQTLIPGNYSSSLLKE